jgi:hypothetical protein
LASRMSLAAQAAALLSNHNQRSASPAHSNTNTNDLQARIMAQLMHSAAMGSHNRDIKHPPPKKRGRPVGSTNSTNSGPLVQRPSTQSVITTSMPRDSPGVGVLGQTNAAYSSRHPSSQAVSTSGNTSHLNSQQAGPSSGASGAGHPHSSSSTNNNAMPANNARPPQERQTLLQQINLMQSMYPNRTNLNFTPELFKN